MVVCELFAMYMNDQADFQRTLSEKIILLHANKITLSLERIIGYIDTDKIKTLYGLCSYALFGACLVVNSELRPP